MVKLTDTAIQVLKKRYFLDDHGSVENLFRAVSLQVCRKEKGHIFEDRCFQSMCNLEFLPNTPTLINASRNNGQYAACFVLPIEDSTDKIFDTLKHTALIHKTGGGTGFSFTNLRPKNSVVSGSFGVSSGPISFMKIFNRAAGEMKQGGVRRGANMGILRIDHPDIEDFILCKNEEGVLSNFNISVAITDDFMECLKQKKKFNLRWSNGKIRIDKKVDPQKLWDLIIKGAWLNGEPGVIFIDTINRNNVLKFTDEVINATNPCGEQPLPDYGVCNLGSINLSKFVKADQSTDYERLLKTIRMAVRFLDNIVSVNTYPLPEIEKEAFRTRRIGLGIMGLADYLILKGITYGSDECLKHLHVLMNVFSLESNKASVELGKIRGIPPALEKVKINRRNGTVTTIAPTGSLSLIAGCSSGCEPIFAKKYKKSCIDTTLDVKSSTIIGEKNPAFVTAMDISPEDHIKVLSVLQQYIDSGISKTINAPNNITESKISELFHLCYDSGCKSVSFYREGSRVFQALTEEKPKEKLKEKPKEKLVKTDVTIRKRPECLNGYTKCIKTGRGKLYVTLNNDENNNPFEVFLRIGKSGMEDLAYSEALGRLISLSLRYGLPVSSIIKNLSGISGESPIWSEGRLIKSVPDAIAYIMSTICGEKVESKKVKPLSLTCPDCGDVVVFEEGCVSCKQCGWSKCS